MGKFQAKKNEQLDEITHKVFFDIEIDGKPSGKRARYEFTN